MNKLQSQDQPPKKHDYDPEVEDLLAKVIKLREELLQEEVNNDPLSIQLKKELGEAHKILSHQPKAHQESFDKEFVQMNQELKKNPKEKITPLLAEIDHHTSKKEKKKTTDRQQKDAGDYSFLLQNQSKGAYSKNEKKQKQKSWKKYTKESRTVIVENRFPVYFYAGFWIRMCAFLVDLICISSITTIFITNLFTFFQWNKSTIFFSPYMLLGLVIYLSYFIFLTKFNHGQTIGKMIFGLRVVSFREKELSWSTVLIREGVCRFILKYPLLMIGYLPAAFTQHKQHVGDFFSDTSVVSINLIKAFRGERI